MILFSRRKREAEALYEKHPDSPFPEKRGAFIAGAMMGVARGYEIGKLEAVPRWPDDWTECHEGVTRKGNFEPCDKPAVAARRDPEDGNLYPVCKKHTRP